MEVAQKKQTFLEFINDRQKAAKEHTFTDRDDYTRWLIGEISEYLEHHSI